jgi:FKBP-type peptidyl-prolyl cis-trans isomerase (trigger factor)
MELDLNDALKFEQMLDLFKDDIIGIHDGKISLSHPSYSKALPFLLLEHGIPTKINEIFSKVLVKLADNKYAASAVASTVANNIDKLTEHTRNELQKRLVKHGYNIG